MERFYFDLENGESIQDTEGTELTSHRGACHESLQLLGQTLRDKGGAFWNDPELRLTVRDSNDLVLMRLTVFGTMAPALR